MILVVCLLALLPLIWLVMSSLNRSAERKLDADIQAAWNRAVVRLTNDQLNALRYQIAEIEVVADAQVLSGQMNLSQSELVRKEAKLRSIRSFLEFGNAFPTSAS